MKSAAQPLLKEGKRIDFTKEYGVCTPLSRNGPGNRGEKFYIIYIMGLKCSFIIHLLFILVCTFLSTNKGVAAMYTFVDERGSIHFTNVPTDPRCRPWIRSFSNDPASFERMISGAARKYKVDPLLVKAVIKAESNYDYLAISKRGAKGLMQLMPATARDMKVSDPFDPKENIFGGTRYLKKLLGLFKGNLTHTLAAYNAGPNLVMEHGGVPDFPETTNYVKRVLHHYNKLKKDT